MTSVLVVGETENGVFTPITGELLAAARKIQASGLPSLAIITGSQAKPDESVRAAAAEQAFVLSHPSLADGGSGAFDASVGAIEKLVRSLEPDVLLFGRTDFGSNIAPRLAVRLGVPVAPDCIDISIDADSGRLTVTRPVYGGNALAVFEFPAKKPQIALIRPRVFDAVVEETDTYPVVEEFDVSDAVGEPRAKLIETVPFREEGVRLEDARVVVAGGRGIGGAAPFEQLQQLADRLGGALGATRAATDAEWVDHSHQIGLTGKTIGPELYIAVGISGASQHMAGCFGARTIVAVNRDPDANIFRSARYGVVGDWQNVLPAFISAVEELTGVHSE